MALTKILIVNNSLAALKFIHSIQQSNFKCLFYGVATSDDLNSLYVKYLDDFEVVPCGDSALNFCNVELILGAAKKFNVDFVWPGWGYLSENSVLPRVLLENKIGFIGPSEESMKMLGDKHAANVLCERLGIPHIPFLNVKIEFVNGISVKSDMKEKFSMNSLKNFFKLDKIKQKEIIKQFGAEDIINRPDFKISDLTDKFKSLNEFFNNRSKDEKSSNRESVKINEGISGFIMSPEYTEFISQNNYPLLLKLSLSGGGKGIRIVNNQNELINIYETVKGEGSGEMILCKIVDNARHIELQMARDKHGNIVCLGGRDCTIQRRHQKLLEESLIIDREKFEEMKICGNKLMKEVQYEGIATIEFLLKDEEYYFLEVNTRIQVEHPVTELESSINIPQIQMIIATGGEINKIKFKKSKNHVLAIRIVAEDPWNGFIPVSGDYKVSYINHPKIFAYFVSNNGTIGKYSDSQFGHIFAISKTRGKSIKLMERFLQSLCIEGINTNIGFMLELLKSKFFIERMHNIKTVEDIMKTFINNKTKNLQLLFENTGCNKGKDNCFLRIKKNKKKPSVELSRSSIRIEPFIMFAVIYSQTNNAKYQELEFAHENINYKIAIYVCSPESVLMVINNSYAKIDVYKYDNKYLIKSKNATEIVKLKENSDIFSIEHKTGIYKFSFFTKNQIISAPTDGKIIKFYKNDGEMIEKNENYIEIEIMKMRLSVVSPYSGILRTNVSVGTFIKANDNLGFVENEIKRAVKYSDYVLNPENSENAGKNQIYFKGILINIELLKNIFKGYVFPDTIWETKVDVGNIDINIFINFVFDFYSQKDHNNEIEVFLIFILITFKTFFDSKSGDDLSFERPLIEILELIDSIIIEKKLTPILYEGFVDLKSKLGQYKFKKRNFFYENIISDKSFKDYIRKNCCHKEGILFSLLYIKEYHSELIEKYLSNILGNLYSEFVIDSSDYTKFTFRYKYKVFTGIFFRCENNKCNGFDFNQDLILHYNCLKPNITNHLYINFNANSPFIKYTYNDKCYQSDEIIHSIIQGSTYNEINLSFKDIFRNLLIFQESNELRIVYKIDTHSQSSVMNIKDLSHAIKEILCAIIITRKKTGYTKGRFEIILAGKILIDPEYIQRVADDCMFYYSKSFIKNGIIKCEIFYENITENKICYRIVRGFLEKFVYENNILLEYSIENDILFSNSNHKTKLALLVKSQMVEESSEREIARKSNTIHIDDFLYLFSLVFTQQNYKYSINELYIREINTDPIKKKVFFKYNDKMYDLYESKSFDKIGIRGFMSTFNSNQFVLIINDITHNNGSFSSMEYIFYTLAIRQAKALKIPFVFISSNSGAKIGLYNKLKDGFLYENNKFYHENDIGVIKNGSEIISIHGNIDSGPENLSFSGLLASETVEAYENILTLSYVTGRSVGIGAYINKLGERIIQKKDSSILLTGFQALNKLLQSNVYKSNTEIGGVSVMNLNGNNHLTVENDFLGVKEIFNWLDYHFNALQFNLASYTKPHFKTKLERRLNFLEKYNHKKVNEIYNEREILENLIDSDTFKEYKTSYSSNIIIGRGKINGKSLGIISTESDSIRNGVCITKNVLFPDSSDKIAQSIKDFSHESLNILIIANFKGFSGGKKEMEENVLKYGSEIVRSLKHCKTKVIIYIPPNGQVRGGSWVVFDKNINSLITIYAHPNSEVGILQPDGICELKFKEKERIEVFSRLKLPYSHENGFRLGVEFCKLHDNIARMYINEMVDDIICINELKEHVDKTFFN